MKSKLVISEFRTYMLQCLSILMPFLIWGIIEVARNNLDFEFLIVITIVLLPIIGFVFYHLRLLGTIWIYEDIIVQSYPLLRRGGSISLNKSVYYTIYSETQFYYPQRYILLSNDPIVFDGDRERKIDQKYETQVKIPYNKRVQRVFPKSNWIEVIAPE